MPQPRFDPSPRHHVAPDLCRDRRRCACGAGILDDRTERPALGTAWAIEDAGGEIPNYSGDGVLAVFDRAGDEARARHAVLRSARTALAEAGHLPAIDTVTLRGVTERQTFFGLREGII